MVSPRSRPRRRMSSPSRASLSWRSFIETILARRGHLDIAGLRPHPREPRIDALVSREVEAAVRRGIRVREERDIGDRVGLADEEVAPGGVLLHHLGRLVAALLQARGPGPPR